MSQTERSRVLKAIKRILNWFSRTHPKEPESPLDPYAYAMAPKKPRSPNRSAAAVAELPEE